LSKPLAAADLAALGTRMSEIAVQLAKLEEHWLTLAERIDSAGPTIS
jgi:hypothetical protein